MVVEESPKQAERKESSAGKEEEEEDQAAGVSPTKNNRPQHHHHHADTEHATASLDQEALSDDDDDDDDQKKKKKASSSSSSRRRRRQSSYTRQDLQAFDILEHPVWVFDIEHKKMWWANTSALTLWNSPTLQALLDRNFAHDMSQATHQRLVDYLRRFRDEGEKISESWTFYPNGEGPVTVHVTCSGVAIRDDDDDDDDDADSSDTDSSSRLAMLVEGDTPKAKDEIDKSALRGVEMLRHLPVPVCQFDSKGKVMYQNPEAAHVFGSGAAANAIAASDGGDDEETNDTGADDCGNDDGGDRSMDDSHDKNDFLQRFVNVEQGKRILKTVLQDGLDFQDEVLQYTRSSSSAAGTDAADSSATPASSATATMATTVASSTQRWFSVKCRPSKDPVTAERVLLYSARDLTDLKEADAMCLAKNEFVATMAHEIRTPLHQVMGFLELLASTRDNMTDFMWQNVQWMENSAQSLMTVVNDILDYTKLDLGRMRLEYIPFNVSQAVLTSIAAVQSKAQAKSIQLQHDVCDDNNGDYDKNDNIPRYLVGDPNRIRQLLLNLLQNAIKFTPENGQISLSVTRIKGDTNRDNCSSGSIGRNDDALNANNGATDNDSAAAGRQQQEVVRLRFEVTDNGIGIDPKHAPHIFNKFQQADASISRNYGGTGLGLSICKHLVAAMNGSIGVSSPGLGHGSTFWMEIPFEVVPNSSLVSSSSSSSASSSLPLQSLATRLPETPNVLASSEALPTTFSSMNSWGPVQSAETPAAKSRTILNNGRDATRNAKAATTTTTTTTPGLHVLVAEDNMANQKLAKAMLKRLGHTVAIAENGAKAIEAVEKAARTDSSGGTMPFHAVLMDIQMPVMDGFKATLELRKRGYTQDKLAIIGLTADYQPSEHQKYLDVGMNECLGKPTRINELRSSLAKTTILLDHHHRDLETTAAPPATRATEIDSA